MTSGSRKTGRTTTGWTPPLPPPTTNSDPTMTVRSSPSPPLVGHTPNDGPNESPRSQDARNQEKEEEPYQGVVRGRDRRRRVVVQHHHNDNNNQDPSQTKQQTSMKEKGLQLAPAWDGIGHQVTQKSPRPSPSKDDIKTNNNKSSKNAKILQLASPGYDDVESNNNHLPGAYNTTSALQDKRSSKKRPQLQTAILSPPGAFACTENDVDNDKKKKKKGGNRHGFVTVGLGLDSSDDDDDHLRQDDDNSQLEQQQQQNDQRRSRISRFETDKRFDLPYRDGSCSKTWKVSLCLIVVIIIAISVSVGLTLSTKNKSDANNNNGEADDDPTMPPTIFYTLPPVPSDLKEWMDPFPETAPKQVTMTTEVLLPETMSTTARFGSAVAISYSGDRLAVAAQTTNSSDGQGQVVFVYEQDNTVAASSNGTKTWKLLGTPITDCCEGRNGLTLAFSGSGQVLAIGDPQSNAPANNDTTEELYLAGVVSVYNWNWTANNWVLTGQRLQGDLPEIELGSSMSLNYDGYRLAVGSWRRPSSSSNNTATKQQRVGQALVYDYRQSSHTWELVGSPINGTYAKDELSRSISLSASGNRLAVGVPGANAMEGYNNVLDPGRVRVFDFQPEYGDWFEYGPGIPGDETYSFAGTSCALSGDGRRLAMSVPFAPTNNQKMGGVGIYESVSTGWKLVGQFLNAPGKGEITLAMSFDGHRVAIGVGIGTPSARVVLYQYHHTDDDNDGEEDQWIPLHSDPIMDFTNDEQMDNTGTSVAISADGFRTAIGADLAFDNEGLVQIVDFSPNQ